MKSRRGISLVELLLALSACSVILTLSAGLIHRIMQVEMCARCCADLERTSLRLANTFRRDVWQAMDASMAATDSDQGTLLRLTLPENQRLEYRQEANSIVRILQGGERAVARDIFMFPAGVQAVVDQPSQRSLQLVLTPAQQAGLPVLEQFPDAHAPPRALQVLARLGRHSQFVAEPLSSEDRP